MKKERGEKGRNKREKREEREEEKKETPKKKGVHIDTSAFVNLNQQTIL